MIDGILLLDKEKDITSYDVIRKLKIIIPRGVKIGHSGTLDPFATGLLVILLGRCTKLMDFFHRLEKEYIVDAEFGFRTDTQDITGEILEESDLVVSKDDVEVEIKRNFIGSILQTPPMFSANKVGGRRAYDLAREGKSFVLTPKEIYISSFDVVEYDYPKLRCRVKCSTGTYIRTLINDLGLKLGCFGTAVDLRRTRIGDFDVDAAVKSSELSESSLDSIIPMDKVLEILKNE